MSNSNRIQTDFSDWLSRNRVQLYPNLFFKNDPITGMSIFSTSDIPVDSSVVKIPAKLAITPQTSRDSILDFLLLFHDDHTATPSLKDPSQIGRDTSISHEIREKTSLMTPHNWIVLYLFLNRVLVEILRPKWQSEGLTSGSENFKNEMRMDTEDKSTTREAENQNAEKESLSDLPLQLSIFNHLPYILQLPSSFSTPLHFFPSELSLLQGTPLYSATIDRLEACRKACFEALEWVCGMVSKSGEVTEVNEMNGGKRKTGEGEVEDEGKGEGEYINGGEVGGYVYWRNAIKGWADDLTRKLKDGNGIEEMERLIGIWRWAETSYGSRAFPPRLLGLSDPSDEISTPTSNFLIGPVLIPGLDTFNHSRGKKVTWSLDRLEPFPSQDPQTQSVSAPDPQPTVVLTLHEPVPKNHQVFNNYGPKSNEEFLGSYGFVNPTCEDDSMVLVLGGKSKQENQEAKKHFWTISDDEAPNSLLEELREILLQQEQEDQEQISEELARTRLEAEVLRTLEIMLCSKRKTFKSFEKVNEEVMRGENGVRREIWEMIRVYRDGQRRILDGAVDWTRREMDRVDELLDQLDPAEEEEEVGDEEMEG